MTVGIYDSTGATIESARGIYSVTLSLTPTGTLSGTTTRSTTAGTVTFTDLYIYSANSFTLSAASTGITTAISSSFTVTNYVYTIALSSTTTTPSVNFSFTITALLFGQDGKTYTGSCTVGLTESTSALQGTSSATIATTGSGTFSVYLTSLGNKSIVATCPASGSSPAVYQSILITPLQEKLQITVASTVIFIQPTNSLSVFSVTIEVYDYYGNTIESARGIYPITLTLSPTGSISGTATGNSASGILNLTGLRILSAGTFTITASSPGITSGLSSSTYPITNYPHTMTLTSSDYTPTVNVSFSITASLYCEDSSLFAGTCTVTLTETTTSSIAGTSLSQAITGTGIGVFSIYITSAGGKTITATCPAYGSYPAVVQTVGVTASTQVLKIICFSPIVINT